MVDAYVDGMDGGVLPKCRSLPAKPFQRYLEAMASASWQEELR